MALVVKDYDEAIEFFTQKLSWDLIEYKSDSRFSQH
jgi:catechol 2,3-dioxygenase-like lactoylglutathione lyase family enzyme